MGQRGDVSGGPQKQEIHFITVTGSGVRGCSTIKGFKGRRVAGKGARHSSVTAGRASQPRNDSDEKHK